jgi:carbon monoxide dehydrogenase subunit G
LASRGLAVACPSALTISSCPPFGLPRLTPALALPLLVGALLCGCASSSLPLSATPGLAADTGTTEPAPPPSEPRLSTEQVVLINAPLEVVWAVLDDPAAYAFILPWVRSAKPLGRAPEGDLLITLVHGIALINADYTMRIRKEPGHIAHMWIDREFPHTIAEAHGEAIFTEAPNNTTRVHFEMSADLGKGSLLWLFAPRIQAEMGKIPGLLRDHVERQKAAQ